LIQSDLICQLSQAVDRPSFNPTGKLGGQLTDRIRCEVGSHDQAIAIHAAEWVSRFYPDVSARAHIDYVELESDRRSPTQLDQLWRTVLTNERLIVEGAASRASLLTDLMA